MQILRGREKTRAEAQISGQPSFIQPVGRRLETHDPQTPIENSRPALMPQGPLDCRAGWPDVRDGSKGEILAVSRCFPLHP
jgi:hypothetical protein